MRACMRACVRAGKRAGWGGGLIEMVGGWKGGRERGHRAPILSRPNRKSGWFVNPIVMPDHENEALHDMHDERDEGCRGGHRPSQDMRG